MQIAGIIAIVGGTYEAWTSWALMTADATGLPELVGLGNGMAFADSVSTALTRKTALPGLIATEPLIWFGFALILATNLYRRIAQAQTRRDTAYVGYAYINCPECDSLAPVSSTRCPLCGAQLLASWPVAGGTHGAHRRHA